MYTPRRPRLLDLALALALAVPLGGCDLLGLEPASAIAQRKEAESKAVGGACRHAGRAIEDCFALNKRADKAAVFAGWREMNDYMRENKIEAVPAQAVAAAESAVRAGDSPLASPQAETGSRSVAKQ